MKRPEIHLRRTVPVALVGASLVAAMATSSVAGAATSSAGNRFPGTSGSVAAVAGSSMEVQNPQSGQVTVNWSASTAFTQTVALSVSSVAVGDCVTVTGTSSKQTITARSVSISQAVSGKCTAGALGGQRGGSGFPSGGGFRRGGGSFRPPTTGSANGSGAPSRNGGFAGLRNIGFASGKVTGVTPENLVLSGFSSSTLRKPVTKAHKGGKPVPSIKPTTVRVTLQSTTTYSGMQTAGASNLAVGDCVTAAGPATSTGAVNASTVRITSTGGKSCTGGFLFGGAGRGAAGG